MSSPASPHLHSDPPAVGTVPSAVSVQTATDSATNMDTDTHDSIVLGLHDRFGSEGSHVPTDLAGVEASDPTSSSLRPQHQRSLLATSAPEQPGPASMSTDQDASCLTPSHSASTTPRAQRVSPNSSSVSKRKLSSPRSATPTATPTATAESSPRSARTPNGKRTATTPRRARPSSPAQSPQPKLSRDEMKLKQAMDLFKKMEEKEQSLRQRAQTPLVDVGVSAESLQKHTTAISQLPEAPTYYPTMDEFQDPMSYISKIAPTASQYGIARIVPPAEWNPPYVFPYANGSKFVPKKQSISHDAESFCAQIVSLPHKHRTLEEFLQMDSKKREQWAVKPSSTTSSSVPSSVSSLLPPTASADSASSSPAAAAASSTVDFKDPAQVEECYWRFLTSNKKQASTYYASDVEGTAFPLASSSSSVFSKPSLIPGALASPSNPRISASRGSSSGDSSPLHPRASRAMCPTSISSSRLVLRGGGHPGDDDDELGKREPNVDREYQPSGAHAGSGPGVHSDFGDMQQPHQGPPMPHMSGFETPQQPNAGPPRQTTNASPNGVWQQMSRASSGVSPSVTSDSVSVASPALVPTRPPALPNNSLHAHFLMVQQQQQLQQQQQRGGNPMLNDALQQQLQSLGVDGLSQGDQRPNQPGMLSRSPGLDRPNSLQPPSLAAARGQSGVATPTTVGTPSTLRTSNTPVLQYTNGPLNNLANGLPPGLIPMGPGGPGAHAMNGGGPNGGMNGPNNALNQLLQQQLPPAALSMNPGMPNGAMGGPTLMPRMEEKRGTPGGRIPPNINIQQLSQQLNRMREEQGGVQGMGAAELNFRLQQQQQQQQQQLPFPSQPTASQQHQQQFLAPNPNQFSQMHPRGGPGFPGQPHGNQQFNPLDGDLDSSLPLGDNHNPLIAQLMQHEARKRQLMAAQAQQQQQQQGPHPSQFPNGFPSNSLDTQLANVNPSMPNPGFPNQLHMAGMQQRMGGMGGNPGSFPQGMGPGANLGPGGGGGNPHPMDGSGIDTQLITSILQSNSEESKMLATFLQTKPSNAELHRVLGALSNVARNQQAAGHSMNQNPNQHPNNPFGHPNGPNGMPGFGLNPNGPMGGGGGGGFSLEDGLMPPRVGPGPSLQQQQQLMHQQQMMRLQSQMRPDLPNDPRLRPSPVPNRVPASPATYFDSSALPNQMPPNGLPPNFPLRNARPDGLDADRMPPQAFPPGPAPQQQQGLPDGIPPGFIEQLDTLRQTDPQRFQFLLQTQPQLALVIQNYEKSLRQQQQQQQQRPAMPGLGLQDPSRLGLNPSDPQFAQLRGGPQLPPGARMPPTSAELMALNNSGGRLLRPLPAQASSVLFQSPQTQFDSLPDTENNDAPVNLPEEQVSARVNKLMQDYLGDMSAPERANFLSDKSQLATFSNHLYLLARAQVQNDLAHGRLQSQQQQQQQQPQQQQPQSHPGLPQAQIPPRSSNLVPQPQMPPGAFPPNDNRFNGPGPMRRLDSHGNLLDSGSAQLPMSEAGRQQYMMHLQQQQKQLEQQQQQQLHPQQPHQLPFPAGGPGQNQGQSQSQAHAQQLMRVEQALLQQQLQQQQQQQQLLQLQQQQQGPGGQTPGQRIILDSSIPGDIPPAGTGGRPPFPARMSAGSGSFDSTRTSSTDGSGPTALVSDAAESQRQKQLHMQFNSPHFPPEFIRQFQQQNQQNQQAQQNQQQQLLAQHQAQVQAQQLQLHQRMIEGQQQLTQQFPQFQQQQLLAKQLQLENPQNPRFSPIDNHTVDLAGMPQAKLTPATAHSAPLSENNISPARSIGSAPKATSPLKQEDNRDAVKIEAPFSRPLKLSIPANNAPSIQLAAPIEPAEPQNPQTSTTQGSTNLPDEASSSSSASADHPGSPQNPSATGLSGENDPLPSAFRNDDKLKTDRVIPSDPFDMSDLPTTSRFNGQPCLDPLQQLLSLPTPSADGFVPLPSSTVLRSPSPYARQDPFALSTPHITRSILMQSPLGIVKSESIDSGGSDSLSIGAQAQPSISSKGERSLAQKLEDEEASAARLSVSQPQQHRRQLSNNLKPELDMSDNASTGSSSSLKGRKRLLDMPSFESLSNRPPDMPELESARDSNAPNSSGGNAGTPSTDDEANSTTSNGNKKRQTCRPNENSLPSRRPDSDGSDDEDSFHGNNDQNGQNPNGSTGGNASTSAWSGAASNSNSNGGGPTDSAPMTATDDDGPMSAMLNTQSDENDWSTGGADTSSSPAHKRVRVDGLDGEPRKQAFVDSFFEEGAFDTQIALNVNTDDSAAAGNALAYEAMMKKKTSEFPFDPLFSLNPKQDTFDSEWSLNELARNRKGILRHLRNPIPGVTDPMLYIGMLFSTFCWHTEDNFLYSISYNHKGSTPKTWYGVPGSHAEGFERVAEGLFPALMKARPNLLLCKTTMFSPTHLQAADVPVYRALQKPGTFVITFPRSYHAGFSHGFSCAESVNFALPDWFEWGRRALTLYQRLGHLPVIPHEELVIRCAQAAVDSDHSDPELIPRLSHELSLIVDSQRHLRQKYTDAGVPVRTVCDSPNDPFPTLYCADCRYACFLSYVKCACHPRLCRCLNHTDATACKGGRAVLYIKYSDAELTALLGRLNAMLASDVAINVESDLPE